MLMTSAPLSTASMMPCVTVPEVPLPSAPSTRIGMIEALLMPAMPRPLSIVAEI
jgi:hypothetical protein